MRSSCPQTWEHSVLSRTVEQAGWSMPDSQGQLAGAQGAGAAALYQCLVQAQHYET